MALMVPWRFLLTLLPAHRTTLRLVNLDKLTASPGQTTSGKRGHIVYSEAYR